MVCLFGFGDTPSRCVCVIGCYVSLYVTLSSFWYDVVALALMQVCMCRHVLHHPATAAAAAVILLHVHTCLPASTPAHQHPSTPAHQHTSTPARLTAFLHLHIYLHIFTCPSNCISSPAHLPSYLHLPTVTPAHLHLDLLCVAGREIRRQ